MLTDRQAKFLDRIQRLTLPAAPSNWKEKSYFDEAKVKIQDGWDFKWVINTMNLELKESREKTPLSLEVQKLYDDLVAVYGEPTKELQKTEGIQHPKDWRDSDPDLVYRGTGRLSSWGERNGKGVATWKPVLGFTFVGINFFVFLFTPFLLWLQNCLGKTRFWIVISVYFLTLLIWFIKSGNLKKIKK